MTKEQFVNKLRELYGEDYLQALSEHYPIQFQHIIKINFYYYFINHAS